MDEQGPRRDDEPFHHPLPAPAPMRQRIGRLLSLLFPFGALLPRRDDPGARVEFREWWQPRGPLRWLVVGWFVALALGWTLLSLPFAQANDLTWHDSLFVAVSAISTTGLSTISTGNDLTGFGQGVVLLLLQVGGVGYLSMGSLLLLRGGQAAGGVRRAVAEEWPVPADTDPLWFVVRRVLVYAAVVEALGVIVLVSRFAASGVDQPVWSGVFHAISAFCTAGFSLYDDSLTRFGGDAVVMGAVSALSLAGAVGFLVLNDAVSSLWSQRSTRTVTRLILGMTSAGILLGTTVIATADATLADAAGGRVGAALFQAMTAMTTVGFNTVDIGGLAPAGLLMILFLMVVGASPAGTGGGLKTTTLTGLVAVLRSTVAGQRDPHLLGARVPPDRIAAAVATATIYFILLAVGSLALALTDPVALRDTSFEAASALGTVGLSTGITGDLSVAGRLVLVVLMFVGRVGPLSMANALTAPRLPPADLGDNELELDV